MAQRFHNLDSHHRPHGPGAIVRWWATANNSGMIRIYLDGSDEPVIRMRPAELVGGNGLAPAPFSFKASDDKTNPDWRGHDLYLPIPYQNGCKVTWEGGGSYYQIQYRKYAPGTSVKTFTMQQLEEAKDCMSQVAAQLNCDIERARSHHAVLRTARGPRHSAGAAFDRVVHGL